LDPEWQLDDEDVAAAWQKVDISCIRALPLRFAVEAAELIASLGRWPRSYLDAGSGWSRAEGRLAHAVNAWCALCAPGSGSNLEVSALMELASLPRSRSTVNVDEAWCRRVEGMLPQFGLSVKGVDCRQVFHHIPSKRRNLDAQHKLLQDAGVYHALSHGREQTTYNYGMRGEPDGARFVSRAYLCAVSSAAKALPPSHVIQVDLWERLFVFQSEFDAYNASGMLLEDPQSYRWCSEKQCFDYTPHVTKADWAARFVEQRVREVNAHFLRSAATPPHKWVSSRWTCNNISTEAGELSASAPGMYGPTFSLWKEVVATSIDSQSGYCIATDSAFSVHAPYQAFLKADWERNCQHWNTTAYKEVLEKHLQWNREDWSTKSPPSSFWTAWCEVASWATPPAELLWVGGTYARSPADFPAEQHESAWIYKHLRPLGIQPSGFMQKLRRGHSHSAGAVEASIKDCPCVPQFPFTLSMENQEAMLSAHLWKHDLPSVWFGEASHLQLRRERYKRVKFYVEACEQHSMSEAGDVRRTARDEALQHLLEVVHCRGRDIHRQTAYEVWVAALSSSPCGRGSTAKLCSPDGFLIWSLRQKMWTTVLNRCIQAMPPESVSIGAEGALRIDGMLGAGLAFPRQVVYVVDAPAAASMAKPSEVEAAELKDGSDMSMTVDLSARIGDPLRKAGASKPEGTKQVIEEHHANAPQGLQRIVSHSFSGVLNNDDGAVEPNVRKAWPKVVTGGPYEVSSGFAGEFAIAFDRDSALSPQMHQTGCVPNWGFTLKDSMVIGEIEAGGFIDQWNQSNPETQIRVGDAMVEVDGKRAPEAELMYIFCRCNQMWVGAGFLPRDRAYLSAYLRLVFRRPGGSN